jgi:hypothetical protein
MGAQGIKAFAETVAEELVYGYSYVTANRYDGYDINTGFKRLLQSYSGSVRADVPGSMGHSFNGIFQVEFADSARVLIDAGEGLFEKPDPEAEAGLLCGVLAQLDLHPLFHTQFLAEYRELSGNQDIVLKPHIAPEIERLAEYLPAPPHAFSSDPSGVNTRFAHFNELREFDPDNPDLFGILAALFVRLDQTENYDELCEQVLALGEYARPALDEIVANIDLFSDEQRGPIRDKSRSLLDELQTLEKPILSSDI